MSDYPLEVPPDTTLEVESNWRRFLAASLEEGVAGGGHGSTLAGRSLALVGQVQFLAREEGGREEREEKKGASK